MRALILLLAVLVVAQCDSVTVPCKELNVTYAEYTYVFSCGPAVSKAAVFHLWRPKQIVVTCTAAPAAVHVRQHLEDLDQVKAPGKPKTAWCGWRALYNPRTCELSVSPFSPSLVGVQLKRGILQAGSCNATWSGSFRLERLLLGFGGIFLFLAAPLLSRSIMFRLTTGSLMFVCLGVLILLFTMWRAIPQKRSLAAGALALGSTGLGFARWVYGSWLPSWQELVTHPFFISYIIIAALVGLAVTYYFDTHDSRAHDILCGGLRVIGLMLLWWSPSANEASLVAVVLLPLSLLPWARWGEWLAGMKSWLSPSASPSPGTPAGTPAGHSLLERSGYVPLPDSSGPPHLPARPPITPGAARPSPALRGEMLPVSPMLQAGLVINAETGRPMRTDSPDYFNMLARGWVVDHVDGYITPPRRASAAATSTTVDPSSFVSVSVNRRRALQSEHVT